jgi:hypothetical protein
MRVRTGALPFVGAAGGAVLGGAYATVLGAIWALTGAPPERALDLAGFLALSGFATGAVLGVCRALDRWLTDPPQDPEGRRRTAGVVLRVFAEDDGEETRLSGGAARLSSVSGASSAQRVVPRCSPRSG